MKKCINNLILVISGLIVGIFLCEILLAVFYPQNIRGIVTQDPFFGQYDSELGWINKKNTEGTFSKGGYIKINSKGLRGMEHPYEKNQSKKRIFVLGDSVTFGYGLNENETYPYILQEELHDGYEVINGGIIGYGLDQEYLFFKREGFRYSPDLLIVGFSAGDIYDSQCSMRFGANKPFFRVVNGNLILFNAPVQQKKSIKDLFFRDKPVQSFFFGNSHLYRLLFYRLTDINKTLTVSTEVMDVFEGMGVSVEIVKALKYKCDKIGCKILFLVIPQEDWIKSYIENSGNEVFKRGHNAAVNVLQKAGVPFIDLWEPFSKNISNGLFLEGDFVHLNRKGNEIIADEIYKRIKDSGVL